MKLNKRLLKIASMVPNCDILADIGTDHAYIPIYAVLNRICSKAVAADLRKGPLEKARENIRKYGVEDFIELRLGNGLEPILQKECDTVVIAGMGGMLIKDILSVSLDKARYTRLLLLQPNNAADVLRKWLHENGFEITEERLAEDAGKIYCIISAKWTGNVVNKDEFYYYIGDKLIESKDPLLRPYIEKKIKELDVIIAGRAKARKEEERKISGVYSMDTNTCVDIRNRLKSLVCNL